MEVVGVITVDIYSSFSELEEWSVPPRDPNRGVHSHRSGGTGDIKDPGEGVTHGANQYLGGGSSVRGGGGLQRLNSRNAAHVKGTVRRLHVGYKVCAEAQMARSARRLG